MEDARRAASVSTSKSLPNASQRALVRPTGSAITKSMSLVARGSPWSELARLPPRKYSAPTEVRALATLSAISIAFSPTSAGIELGVWEESGSDLAPIKAQGEARTHHFVRCIRLGGTDG